MRTEEEYLDILQNIEAVVVSEFRDNRMLSDYNIDEVYDALIDDYRAEEIQGSARTRKFAEAVQPVYEQVRQVCEWRLGKGESPDIVPVSLDVMIRCPRRLKKLLHKWNDRNGRPEYLEYIDHFIPGASCSESPVFRETHTHHGYEAQGASGKEMVSEHGNDDEDWRQLRLRVSAVQEVSQGRKLLCASLNGEHFDAVSANCSVPLTDTLRRMRMTLAVSGRKEYVISVTGAINRMKLSIAI